MVLFLALSGGFAGAGTPFSCPTSEHWPVNNLPLWSRPGIAIYPDSTPLMQGVTSRVFVVAGKDFEYGGSKILALDIQSGNVLWQRNVIQPGRSIITSNSQLYADFNDKIEIVDPQTGKLVKRTEIPHVGPIHNIFATDHNLYAITKSGRQLTYNVDYGTYSLSEPFLPYRLFLIENGVMYLYEDGAFKAKETETQSILWEYSANEAFTAHPLITNKVIILLTQMGSVYSVDKGTGKLLWKLDEHTISNVVANKSQLYFLTKDGYLKVLDMNNGQEITKLEFTHAPFALNSPSSDNIIGAYNIWVDSQKDIVVVSFGDSCQVMGIKLEIQ
jgi:outer membrane protein assembly factor BamB